jgi:hypothetical protein
MGMVARIEVESDLTLRCGNRLKSQSDPRGCSAFCPLAAARAHAGLHGSALVAVCNSDLCRSDLLPLPQPVEAPAGDTRVAHRMLGGAMPNRKRARVRYGLIQRGDNYARPQCGAKTRRGTACARKALANGRCPNHGGLSTGPKTAEGRRRISEAQRRRWARSRGGPGEPGMK